MPTTSIPLAMHLSSTLKGRSDKHQMVFYFIYFIIIIIIIIIMILLIIYRAALLEKGIVEFKEENEKGKLNNWILNPAIFRKKKLSTNTSLPVKK